MTTYPVLELSPNGDPYGSGFVATEFRTKKEDDEGIGIYRGDIGARPRNWWRLYALRNDFRLREYR